MRLLSFSFLLCSLLLTPASASSLQSYVVYMGAHSHSHVSSVDLNQVTDSHYHFLASFLGSREAAEEAMFYSYTRHINGFAAHLSDVVAAQIANHPKVVSVFLNRGRKLHTTRSWDFLGLEQDGGAIPHDSIWNKARFGEDTIIGNLDTGAWPESKSFSDEGFGPVPARWKGICQNDTDATFHCNRKLIGARYFNKAYAAVVGKLNSSLDTPRDNDGHGSHTLSTAGGNFVAGASVFGFGKGTAKGGSPRARVAAYKVCWPPVGGNECFDADIIGAFDIAIHDGVDVLSVSLGGDPTPLFNDSVAIGSFHAVKHGIVVICSAGNSGPAEATVSNFAPWQITVGASTMDREFSTHVFLANNLMFKGQSLSAKALPRGKFFPLINSADAKTANSSLQNATLCKSGSLDPNKAKGKIVVCLRGQNARVDKGEQVALAGGVGMILASDSPNGNEIIADPHVLPASHVNFADGASIYNYINSTKFPKAYISPVTTQLGTKPAPFMAAFSSKGPSRITPNILKPDITAPGVSVIAAYTGAQGPTNQVFDKRRVQFNSVSGTSMSCPHVSGIAGLLKTLYPTWTPAAIKSAIMTTAGAMDNRMEAILNASYDKATPFSYGSGHVRPNSAMDPGLVYDVGVNDYLNYLCALGYDEAHIKEFSEGPYKCPPKPIDLPSFNYPSITVPQLSKPVALTRTLKNVGSPGTYRVRVQQPVGVSVSVKPTKLKFSKVGEDKSYSVTLTTKKGATTQGYVFGELVWTDGIHFVKSPIVVKQA